MAQLTPAQFAAKLKAKVVAIQRDNLPLKIAANTVHALRVLRIFHEGKNQTGGKITPDYNKSKPLYVPNDKLRRSGGNKGKTGKPIKTNYFKSYFDLKRQQGFDPNTVNWRMTNNLQSDYANAQLSKASNAVPKPNTIKINVNHYVERLDREENIEKLSGLKKKYGNVTAFTQAEREMFNTVFAGEMNKLLSA